MARETSSAEGASNLGGPWTCFPKNFFFHFVAIGMNSFNFSFGSKTTNDSKHRARGPLKTARKC